MMDGSSAFCDGSAILRASSACGELVWQPFSDLADSTALHAPNITAWDAYDMVDLLPERHSAFPSLWPRVGVPRMPRMDERQRLVPTADARILMGECSASGSDGTWHHQRIGPFRSMGGFDWVALYFADAAHLSASRSLPATVSAFYAGPVTASGLSAPIHQHHTHIVPGKGVSPRVSALETIARTRPVDPCYMLQVHGDVIDECFGRSYASVGKASVDASVDPAFGFEVGAPLSVSATLNDVRAGGSSPLVYYYQVSVHVLSRAAAARAQSLSVFFPYQPFRMPSPGQLDDAVTIAVLTDEETFFYYTGRLPWGGRLLDVELHTHMHGFQEAALLLGSTPRALGLAGDVRPALWPAKPWLPIRTARTGFVSNAALRDAILRDAPPPLCHAVHPGRAVRQSTWHDAPARLRCAPLPLALNAGMPYVVLAFMGPARAAMSREAAAEAGRGSGGGRAHGAETIGQHVYFAMLFSSAAPSRFSCEVGTSQTLGASPRLASALIHQLRIGLHGGSPQGPPSVLEYVALTPLIALAWLLVPFDRHPHGPALLCSLLVLLVLMASGCYSRRRKQADRTALF